jgi:predicted transcriptional regulator
VSEAELEVLKALWEHGPGTVRALHTLLQGRGHRWAYTTVQTMLQRLEAKGHVRSERGGPAHVYAAAVSREALLNRRLHALAEQLCDGTTSPLLLALVEGGRLTAEEVRCLRQLLDRLEEGPAGPGGRK